MLNLQCFTQLEIIYLSIFWGEVNFEFKELYNYISNIFQDIELFS